MRKKLFFVLGCLLLLLLGVGIAELVEIISLNTLKPGEIYKSKNVTVVELEPGAKPMTRISGSAPYDEKVAFSGRTSVVVTGTVTKVWEVEAFFYSEEFNLHDSSKMTIFELAVDEYLYTASDALAGKDTLRIGTGFSSYSTSSSLPMIKEGKSFLVSCRLASELENDVAYRKEYMDCWVHAASPHLHEGAGSKYLMDDIFAQYLSPEDLIVNVLGASEEQIRAYADPDNEDTISQFGIDDPNGLLDVLKERMIGWDKDWRLLGNSFSNGVWSYAQSCYAIDKKAAEDLLLEIVKRNN